MCPFALLPRVALASLTGLIAASLTACATTPPVLGLAADGLAPEGYSPGPNDALFSPGAALPLLDEGEQASAQSAETERALNDMWAVARSSDAPGARWEFRYWVDGGALTLLSFRRIEEGEGRAAPADRASFLSALRRNLPTLLGTTAREATFFLEREEAGWKVALDTSTRDAAPLQARTLPSARWGHSEARYPQALAIARGLLRLMSVPRGGSTGLEVRLELEDDRVSGWELSYRDASGSGEALFASEAEVTLVTHSLRPFLSGLGQRTVVLKLEGTHSERAIRPSWYIEEARTLEPRPLPREIGDFGREYLAMRERILRESQEGMREGMLYLAGVSLEHVATMLLGGFVMNRALVLFEAVAPTVTSFLARGGLGAVRWFRNLLVRMPATERKALQQLWLKAETQGFKALTEAEKGQLRTLMGKLEALLKKGMDEDAKGTLRGWARTEYFKLYRPDFAKTLGNAKLKFYDIHHVCPLEYAHLFPKLDINASANLVGVHREVHKSIGRVWSVVRPAAGKMAPQDISRVMGIVHRHYQRWFHQVYDPSSAAALTRAEQAALAEAAEVLAALAR